LLLLGPIIVGLLLVAAVILPVFTCTACRPMWKNLDRDHIVVRCPCCGGAQKLTLAHHWLTGHSKHVDDFEKAVLKAKLGR